jgi:hypothetical protein
MIDLLLCYKCRLWKSKTSFSKRNAPNRTRKYQYYCKSCMTEARDKSYRLHPGRKQEQDRNSYYRHRTVRLAKNKQLLRSRKIRVLQHYSSSVDILKCSCCEETEVVFLTLEHIGGGGTRHRKEIKRGGSAFYTWVIRNNFPSGYEVLCMNCQFGRAFNAGVCPHKAKETKINEQFELLRSNFEGR